MQSRRERRQPCLRHWHIWHTSARFTAVPGVKVAARPLLPRRPRHLPATSGRAWRSSGAPSVLLLILMLLEGCGGTAFSTSDGSAGVGGRAGTGGATTVSGGAGTGGA